MPPIPLSVAAMAFAALATIQTLPRGSATAAVPIAQSHEIVRAADRLFYARATIDGVPIRFLVDTGASVSVLSSRDAKKLGFGGGPYARDRIATAGGSRRLRWARIDGMRIGDRRIRGVRAAVIDGHDGVSLIGHDILDQFDSVSIERDRMRLR